MISAQPIFGKCPGNEVDHSAPKICRKGTKQKQKKKEKERKKGNERRKDRKAEDTSFWEKGLGRIVFFVVTGLYRGLTSLHSVICRKVRPARGEILLKYNAIPT